MQKMQGWVNLMDRLDGIVKRLTGHRQPVVKAAEAQPKAKPTGTFTQYITPEWLRQQLAGRVNFKIWVWRSASVRFLRAVIRPWLCGKLWLRLLYNLEERNPGYYGENGQYPMIVIRK